MKRELQFYFPNTYKRSHLWLKQVAEHKNNSEKDVTKLLCSLCFLFICKYTTYKTQNKDKGKVVHKHPMMVYAGMKMCGQLHVSADLLPRKEPTVPTEQETAWAPNVVQTRINFNH